MIRTFRKSRGLFATIVLTLGTGIAACTAMFSVLHGVLRQRLPFPNAESLLFVSEQTSKGESGVSFRAFDAWREQTRTVARMGAVIPAEVTLTGNGDAARIHVGRVTAELLPMLGGNPARGRTFVREDDDSAALPVAIISDEMWRARFGAGADAIGTTLTLDGVPHEIVGVLQPGFDYPNANTDVWTPVRASYRPFLNSGGTGFLQVVARARDGVTPGDVAMELRRIEHVAGSDADDGEVIAAHVTTLSEHLAGDLERTLLMLFLAGVLVLAVCCANVATLLLMRGAMREQEFAMRRALGATSGRVVREVLREGAVIMACACVAGLMLSWAILALVAPRVAAEMPPYSSIRLDGSVVLAGALAAILTTLLASIAPVLHVTHAELTRLIGNGGARASETRGRKHAREALVIGELALTMTLLVAAGLVAKSFIGMTRRSLGLDADHVLAGTVSRPTKTVFPWQREAIARFASEVTQQLGGQPGVVSSAISGSLPSAGSAYAVKLRAGSGADAAAGMVTVTPGYFATLGIPQRGGRALDDADNVSSPALHPPEAPVEVSEALARRLFPGASAIGRHITGDGPIEQLEVVGVVGDARQHGLAEPDPLVVYVPFARMPSPMMVLLVRTTGEPTQATPIVRAAVRRVDPDQPVTGVVPLADVFAHSIVRPRLYFEMLTAISLAAIFVAGVGVYAVVGFSVRQRTLEMGIRAAFGATASGMMRLVLLEGARMAAVGIVIGSALAWMAARLLTSVLVDVRPADPAVFALAALAVLCIAILGSLLPARSIQELEPARIIGIAS